MIYLPDVNCWLALAFESHVHHAKAKHWFESVPLSDTSVFCRLTQQGFLRLATDPKAFPGEAVTLAGAWQLFDARLADPGILFLDEVAGIEPTWRRFTAAQAFSPKVWSDAYLAALAVESSSTVVTFDHDFSKFDGAACQILST